MLVLPGRPPKEEEQIRSGGTHLQLGLEEILTDKIPRNTIHKVTLTSVAPLIGHHPTKQKPQVQFLVWAHA